MLKVQYSNFKNLIKIVTKSYFLFFIFALLLVSCGPKGSYGVKSFFFDGVPNPLLEDGAVAIDSVSLGLLDSVALAKIVVKKPAFVIHKPYLEKKCNDCHSSRMGKLKTPLNELCLTCHDNFDSSYSEVHGPVASGNCAQCHSPHKSKLKGLLLIEGNDLCFNCHDERKIVNYQIHKAIEDKGCTNCHNPHGGATEYLLQKNACFECHTNFEEKYTNLHGPVGAGGLCATCHESHSSPKESLLKLAGNELCLNCHNQYDIYALQTHVTSKKQNCTTCHNPHGSNEHYLLTKAPVE